MWSPDLFQTCPQEGGLLGSQAVAAAYAARKATVVAMSQVGPTFLLPYPTMTTIIYIVRHDSLGQGMLQSS